MYDRKLIYLALFASVCLLSPVIVFSAELTPYQDKGSTNFSLPDLKDKIHALSDYRDKVVLVNFWASWCMPCVEEMPELTRLKKQLADQPFEILALNVGEKKYWVRKFIERINFNLPVLLDTSKYTFNNWGCKTLPTSFLIDTAGNVQYRVRGNPEWNNEQTLSLIVKLIKEAEKPDSTKQ